MIGTPPPPQPEPRATQLARGLAGRRERAAEGLAWAHEWRERMRPYFDTLYGAEPRCGKCGCRP